MARAAAKEPPEAGRSIGRFLLTSWPEEVAIPRGDRVAIFVNTNFPDKLGDALVKGVEELAAGSKAHLYLIGTDLDVERIKSPRHNIAALLKKFRERGGETHIFDVCLTCKGLSPAQGFSTRDIFQILRESDRLEILD
jgi:hypothetical protein